VNVNTTRLDGRGEVLVAQDEADVMHAIRRDHPNPVRLESTTGGPLHINWDYVAFVEETLARPTATEGE
jgi:hypothetical protein